MTFLEFVYRKFLGSPKSGNSYRCPYCKHGTPSLTINPPLAGKAVKYRCHRCQMFGDEFDVLKLVGVHNYSDRIAQVAELRAEYESLHQRDAAQTPDSSTHHTSSFPPRGLGSVGQNLDPRAVEIAYADLTGDEVGQLATAVVLARERLPADPERLLLYCFRSVQWFEEVDARHLAECNDADCDAIVCRAARGLPPLTQEQIEAERRERPFPQERGVRHWKGA